MMAIAGVQLVCLDASYPVCGFADICMTTHFQYMKTLAWSCANLSSCRDRNFGLAIRYGHIIRIEMEKESERRFEISNIESFKIQIPSKIRVLNCLSFY